MVHKQRTRHNHAESPSSPPKEVVHASAATCPCSQRSLLHAVQLHGVQCSSFCNSLSSHMVTTITLPKGIISLLIRQSTADILPDICSVHPQIAPKKDHENKWVYLHHILLLTRGARVTSQITGTPLFWTADAMLVKPKLYAFLLNEAFFLPKLNSLYAVQNSQITLLPSQKLPPPPKLSQLHLGIQGFIARCVTDKIGTDVYYFWGC